MDQLTAYEILGLSPDSSTDKIKEAYATLSKQYHPEEEPEKFREIHEAYVTLTRRKRRGDTLNTVHEMEDSFAIQTEQKKSFIDKDAFNRIELEFQTQRGAEYSFDDALEKVDLRERGKSQALVLEAAAELKILTSPKYKNRLREYKEFFQDKKYAPIIRRADFMEKLCDILEETKLCKNIYVYIIDFYRLRGKKPSELNPIGLRLYKILGERASMKRVNPSVYGVLIGFGVALCAFRPILRQNDMLSGAVSLGILVFLLLWFAKQLGKKFSILFTQAVTAVAIVVSQFLVIMFNLYGTLFGTVDAGNTVASIIFLLALLWFAIIAVVAVVKTIIELFR